jgi:hypothetical protein
MQDVTQAAARWHDFYTVLGEASATMTGLLFVASSVGTGIFTQERRGALRIFFSASVVQFACILFSSLIVLAPLHVPAQTGGLIVACGVFGLGYSAVAWRDAVRDGLTVKLDLDDRLWYAAGPPAGYMLEAAAGLALIVRPELGCAALAAAMGALLLVALHNAWDITVWIISRRRE